MRPSLAVTKLKVKTELRSSFDCTPPKVTLTGTMLDPAEIDAAAVLNINVGVLGHVDSGKTSLVKALSTLLSTAALDKSQQSRQRGMTLDLGFSCFFLDMPNHLREAFPTKSVLQITLVDCPGHASLIRTIIGGAQIIDVVLLVVHAVKGWQAQTTECLVLAELCSPHLVVALNKMDQLVAPLPDAIAAATKAVQHRLAGTRFSSNSTPIVAVSACVGGEKVAAIDSDYDQHKGSASQQPNETLNIPLLVETLRQKLPIPNRTSDGPFYFAIDHCFPMRGRGTVLTGTCLSGQASVGDVMEFPALALQRKIKSLQMFSRPVSVVQQGDRAGMGVSSLDADLLERGLAAAPGAVPLWKGALAVVRKVSYYTGRLPSRTKFHISVGHVTVMATVTFWGARELLTVAAASSSAGAVAQGTTPSTVGKRGTSSSNAMVHGKSSLGGGAEMAGLPKLTFDFEQGFLQQDGLLESLEENNASTEHKHKPQQSLLHWAMLDFQTPVHCPLHSLIIGSRLDTVDNATGDASTCRLAFSGRLVERIDPDKDASRIRWYVPKQRQGIVSRRGDLHKRSDNGKVVCYEIVGSDLFKAETNMKPFLGMKLVTSSGDVGEIKSSFGTSGKFRVLFPAGTDAREGDALILPFKRFANDPDKAMHQDLVLPAPRPGTLVPVEKKRVAKKSEPGVHRFGKVSAVKGDTLSDGKHTIAIVEGFFAPEINIRDKVGTVVLIPGTGEKGSIAGPFGKAGKCKVIFELGISAKVGDKAELCS
jgi:selenocysteine-specific elongation factor